MRGDTQRYLERFCDHLAASRDQEMDRLGAGMEPFGLAAELRYSPTRTKAVMRELMQHHLLDVQVAVGADGQNELRLTWNRETERWYARTLRFRRLSHPYHMA